MKATTHPIRVSAIKQRKRINGCWKAVMDQSVFAMMRYNKDNTIAVHSVIT